MSGKGVWPRSGLTPAKPGFMSSGGGGRWWQVAKRGWALGPGHGLVPFLSPDFQKWTSPHQALCQPPLPGQPGLAQPEGHFLAGTSGSSWGRLCSGPDSRTPPGHGTKEGGRHTPLPRFQNQSLGRQRCPQQPDHLGLFSPAEDPAQCRLNWILDLASY